MAYVLLMFNVRNLRKNAKYPVVPGHDIIAEISMIGSEIKNLKKVI